LGAASRPIFTQRWGGLSKNIGEIIMTETIIDGTGTSNKAKVNSDNQLVVALDPVTTTNYSVLRAISATDDTGLSATAAKWSDVANDMVELDYTAIKTIGMIHIKIRGTDTDDEAGNWCLYACKGQGDAPEFVAYGTFILGATTTGGTDTYWADTIAITEQNWHKTVYVVAGNQYNLGTGSVDGGVAKLDLDSCEYKFWLMLMSTNTNATGGADISNFA